MDAKQAYSTGIVAAADRAVNPDELSGLEMCRIGPESGDACDGTRTGDKGCGVGVLALPVVDLSHIRDDICAEDADYCTARNGVGSWEFFNC